jgi:type I restriction enzyme S subunit
MSFPRYPKYKDSGVEWLAQVPEHWDVRRLGYYFDERREKVSDRDYPALSVTKNGIVPQLETAAKTDDGDNRKRVCARDFVINSRSDRKGSAGVAAIEGSVSLICTVLSPRPEVLPAFVHHLLRSVPFQEEFYRYGKGIVADLWSTNYGEMRNILLAVPTPSEQAAIAAFLDRETAKIDALIAEQQRLIELLQEKRQAVISHAVTKGLNPDAPMKDSGIEWLREVPEHWRVLPLKRLGSIRYGIGEPPKYHDDGMPLIRATNVRSGVLTPVGLVFVNPEEIPCQRIVWLDAGDIIVVRSGAGTGDSAIVPQDYGPAIAGFDMVLRLHNSNAWFIQFALLSKYVKEGQIDVEKMRAAQPHLNAEELGGCHVVLPPEDEQTAIVNYLLSRTQQFDSLTAQAQRAITLLQERRAALISAAVTGQIDVRGLASAEAA